MKCLHGSIHNQTDNTLRLSCDVRYQPTADIWDNRWVPSGDGARPSGHGGEEAPEKTMTLEEAKVAWGIAPRQASL